MTEITSRQHPVVKQFREAAHGGSLMLLDGWHLIAEALGADVSIGTLAVCGPMSADQQALIERARNAVAHIVELSDAVLKALSPVNSPTGVVATARKPLTDPAAMLMPAPPLVLAGIGIQDPGNAGAVIRSAAAAGATGVIVDEATADPLGWKALRASMGAVFHLPVVRSHHPVAILREWQSAGVRLVAAVPRDGVPLYEVDLAIPVVVMVGGEGPGLSADVLAAADVRLTIPMTAVVESLNVAVAAALILYEAKRQRAR